MRLAYNGITLGIVQVIENSKTAEYDPTGQDYLWTRYRIAVEAIYNPDDPNFAVAYTSSPTGPTGRPDPLGNLVRNQQASPVYTDVALRHRLMQPRGLLVIDFSSDPDPKKTGDAALQLWLTSPPLAGDPANPNSRRPCDLNNGPLPQEDTIVREAGNGRTFVVRFVIETCLNDCKQDNRSELSNNPNRLPPPPLLSNRWTASMSYDDGGYATRTFTGLAIFRADVLRQAQGDDDPYWAPDAWRLAILPPVPKNAVRYVDEITPSPDGFSYRYVVRDVEEPVSYLDQPTKVIDGRVVADRTRRRRNVRKISCLVSRQFQSAGTREMVDMQIANLQQMVDSSRQAAMSLLSGGVVGSAIAAGLGTVNHMLGTVAGLNRAIPTYSEVVVCTVQGSRNATKASLFRLAYSCAFGQLSNPLTEAQQGQFLAGGIYSLVPSGTPGAEQIKKVISDSYANMGRLIPPATTIGVQYDAFEKKVQVTVAQEFGGLMDWATGAVAGGLRMVTRAPAEEVMGGDWPQYYGTLLAINDGVFAAPTILAGAQGVFSKAGVIFPTLDDNGDLLGTTQDGDGVDLPLASPPPSPAQPPLYSLPPSPAPYQPPRQGTQLFNVIAQSLSGNCTQPASYDDDRTSSFRQNGQPPAP